MDPKDDETHAVTDVLPVLEERVRIDKRSVLKGSVRVRTVNELVDDELEQTLSTDVVDVERVPVGRLFDLDEELPDVRLEGDTTVIPVFEEVVVVERRLRLVEEVRLTRRQSTETISVPTQLRRQRVIIERAGPDGVFNEENSDNEE